MIDWFLGVAFGLLSILPVLEYCSAVLCLAAVTHLKLLDRVVSGVSFLTMGVFECDLAHRLSVAGLYILYKIRRNQMHPLYGALPGPCVSVIVTLGALVAHRYTTRLLAAEPKTGSRSNAGLFIPLSVSPWNDLGDAVFDDVGLTGFKSRPINFYWPCCSFTFCLLLFSLSLL